MLLTLFTANLLVNLRNSMVFCSATSRMAASLTTVDERGIERHCYFCSLDDGQLSPRHRPSWAETGSCTPTTAGIYLVARRITVALLLFPQPGPACACKWYTYRCSHRYPVHSSTNGWPCSIATAPSLESVVGPLSSLFPNWSLSSPSECGTSHLHHCIEALPRSSASRAPGNLYMRHIFQSWWVTSRLGVL